MARIIVLDDLAQEGLTLLDQADGIQYDVRTGLKGEQLRSALLDYDGAICRSGVKLTADVLEGNRRLRAIVRAGVGTDNIDKTAATRMGILVMNTPAGNTLSTAEHTITMMMAMSRNIVPACRSLIEGRWDRKLYMGSQLAGKTLGIVGMGRIGQAVAKRAIALEMRILAYDPFLVADKAREMGVELVETVDEMLPELDYLTVHTPLTEETRNLIDLEQLEKIKPGLRLVNCARGGIYNEQALLAGLESGKIAGVALDVYENEPCTDSPLFGMPGVVATPHLGASTEEAQTSVAVEAVSLLLDYLQTGAIRHAVNMAPVDPKTLASLRGSLNVAYRLGILLAQLHRHGAKSCEVTYRGEIASKDTKLLTVSFAAGLLYNALDEEANIVNSEVLLRERGIKLETKNSAEGGAFSSTITVELKTESKTFRATGTLFGHDMARLVGLEGYRLEAYLDGCMLIFHHRDVPGIIGLMGTICGKHNVNIAQMAVGREATTPGGSAIGVLNLDSAPPQVALDELLANDAISNVEVLHLPPANDLPSWLQ